MTNSSFHRRPFFGARSTAQLLTLAGIFVAAVSIPAFGSDAKEPAALRTEGPGDPTSPRTPAVRFGTLPTKEGLTLRLNADLGSVNIVPLEAGAAPIVRYTVHIETDAHKGAAEKLLNNYSLRANSTASGVEIIGSLPPQASHSGNAQFFVQFEIAIPRSYNVEVTTELGDINTGDIGGTARLQTQAGSIYAGKIGGFASRSSRVRPVAKLETQGGQIQVLDVNGDLTAFTAGGHINAGNITGDASLHSGGGHIRAGTIGGRAELDTAGGNITVAKAGNLVSVRTGGGQIDFGEVRGSVRAQTGGGGIRVMTVSGPMEVESNAGSICLTRVADAVQASTSGGTITAWINPDVASGAGLVRLGGPSQLASGNGDIVVFLPRNLAATLDATVVNGSERQIEADSALNLNIQAPVNGNGLVHAMASLHGGGPLLKLRTIGGKIRLQYLDTEVAYHMELVREQVDRLNKKLEENGMPPVALPSEIGPPAPTGSTPPPPPPNTDWIDSWLNSLELTFRGSIGEDPDEFFKRITYHPTPSYPALAQRAGVHGMVKLQVRLTKEGHLEVQKVLEGEPVLVDAAIDAVRKWQAKPCWMHGKNVEVISTLTFDFQLR
ncbi:MAG TPA: energy transducer TonB [Candidatus Acidoferrum sp.]|nr:energy transducer TonB [Candidatus Acidoferrum sp.]